MRPPGTSRSQPPTVLAASKANTKPAAAREVDDEALVARRMPVGQHGGDAGRELGVAGGEPPVDARVVIVDPEHAVPLGLRSRLHGIFVLSALRVDRHPAGEVPQPASGDPSAGG